MSEIVYLLTGSNLGDRKALLDVARGEIGKEIGQVSKVSSVYESEPWGFSSDEWFLNQVIVCVTILDPQEVMARLIGIENKMGRTRQGSGYTSRTIDIDMLYYGSKIVDNDSLILPHPRLHLRRFVLEPLCELAPDFVHPVLLKCNKELLHLLPVSETVSRFGV
jgi:2-amino-4-hydroxy-6-hydroxymethyldihydropteridine diphosphokinase